MKQEIEGLVADLGEVVLDHVLDEGLLKEIPVVGSLIAFANLGHSISDKIFRAKVKEFLHQLEGVGPHTIQGFAQELESENLRKKVGEVVLLSLNSQDELEKCSLLGFLFKKRIEGGLTQGEFQRLGVAVSRSTMEDLERFAGGDLRSSYDSTDPISGALGSCGILEQLVEPVDKHLRFSGEAPVYTISYETTELGRKFHGLIGPFFGMPPVG